MKKIYTLLALIACAFASFAFANSAIITSLTGAVSAQAGSAPARTLRQGDEVVQGTTVTTGANSSAVLRFADGQVAALTSNSQMAITEYKFEQSTGQGSMLLSLVRGGMRAITGLLGKAHPQQLTFRAATATIGIRGTDFTVATNGADVSATVAEGAISFAYSGKMLIIPAGQGVLAKRDGTLQQGTASQAMNQSPADVAGALNGAQNVQGTIQQASRPASGNSGQGQGEGTGNNPTVGNPPGPPSSVPGVGNGGTPGGGGGGGGGGASRS